MTFTITAQRQGGLSTFCNRCVPFDQVARKCHALVTSGYINVLAVSEDERRLSFDEWQLEQERDFEVGVCTAAGVLFIIAVGAWLCYSYATRDCVEKYDEPQMYDVRNAAQNGGAK